MKIQDSYTTFTNYKNEEVTISGSIVIEKERFEVIRENQDIKVYKATYKGKCSENTFVGNRRLVRARLVLKYFQYISSIINIYFNTKTNFCPFRFLFKNH